MKPCHCKRQFSIGSTFVVGWTAGFFSAALLVQPSIFMLSWQSPCQWLQAACKAVDHGTGNNNTFFGKDKNRAFKDKVPLGSSQALITAKSKSNAFPRALASCSSAPGLGEIRKKCSPLPTRAAFGRSLWNISGSCFADQEDCIHSPNWPRKYNDDDFCEIRTNFPANVTFMSFHTEGGYDSLLIRSYKWNGLVPALTFSLEQNQTLIWTADSWLSRPGWRICPDIQEVPTPSSMWSVNGSCSVDADDCLTSPNFPQNYGSSESCYVTVLWPHHPAIVADFRTEQEHDMLTINGINYSGSQIPYMMRMEGEIIWTSDQGSQKAGWRICPLEAAASWNPSPTTLHTVACDSIDWTDACGKTCRFYEEQNECTISGDYGVGWPRVLKRPYKSFASFSKDGLNSLVACCSCGGGALMVSGSFIVKVADIHNFFSNSASQNWIKESVSFFLGVTMTALELAISATSSNDTGQHSFAVDYTVATDYPAKLGNSTVRALSTTRAWSLGGQLAQRISSSGQMSLQKLINAKNIRIVGRSGQKHRGRLEIFQSGQWGTVCSRYFTDIEARIACRELGYSDGVSKGSTATMDIHLVWLDQVKCNGNEQSWMDCTLTWWKNTSLCDRRQDHASVECSIPTCIDSPAGWTDSWGYTCSVYSTYNFCNDVGDYSHGWDMTSMGTFEDRTANNHTAKTACCACGGGDVVRCQDEPIDWRDQKGFTCVNYEVYDWCNTSGGKGPGWNRYRDDNENLDTYAHLGFSAATACCACGGGACKPGSYAEPKHATTVCSPCPRGRYTKNKASVSCDLCEPGTMQSHEGATECIQCQVGSYASAHGSSICRACTPGRVGGASHTCSKCPQGHIQSQAGATSCQACSPGTFAPEAGYSECSMCPEGYFTAANAASACWHCGTGEFFNLKGASGCKRCPAGKYASKAGMVQCEHCDSGTYSNSLGANSCKTCAVGSISSRSGSSGCQSCSKGKYSDHDGHNICEECPSGKTTRSPGQSSCEMCPAGKGRTNIDCNSCRRGEFSKAGICSACPSGKFQSNSEATSCHRCESGRFSSNQSSTACQKCTLNSTTDFQGASRRADCRCPVQTLFLKGGCKTCPSAGLSCPGHHSIENNSQDQSPQLLKGYMSLSSDPLSIYYCVKRDAKRCPAGRGAYDSARMCRAGYNPNSARCASCATGYFLDKKECKKCSSQDFDNLLIVKLILLVCAEVGGCIYLYFRWNRATPAGLVAYSFIVHFIQVLNQQLDLPLVWPSTIEFMNMYLGQLSLDGLRNVFRLHHECFTPEAVNFWPKFSRNLLAPLIPIVSYAILFGFSHLIRKPMNTDFVWNCIGLVYKTVFISISSITLEMFIYEKMPNGKLMVNRFPELEIESELWYQAFPLSLLAFLAYCVTFVAVIARAVWIAPAAASTWPGFSARYRFAFGALRPDRWWWILGTILYSFAMVLVQVLSSGVYERLYLSTFVLITVLVLQFECNPFKFNVANNADLVLKSALLIFLIVATSFLDSDNLASPSEKEIFAKFGISVIVLAMLYPTKIFVCWACSLAAAPESNLVSGNRLKTSFAFRDVVSEISMLPDKFFVKCLAQLSEADVERLDQVIRTVVAIFLRKQPGAKWTQKRIMPGAPYEIWDSRTSTLDFIEHVLTGEQSRQLRNTVRDRIAVMCLAEDLRVHLPNQENDWKNKVSTGINGFSNRVSNVTHADLGQPKLVTADDFCEIVAPYTRVSRSDLQAIFDLLDCHSSGELQLSGIMTQLTAEAPQLNEEQRVQLRKLLLLLESKPSATDAEHKSGNGSETSNPATDAEHHCGNDSETISSLGESILSLPQANLPQSLRAKEFTPGQASGYSTV